MKLAKAGTETRVAKEEAIAEATRSLQVKHEQICADLKIVKANNHNLNKELDIKRVAIQTATKEAKDAAKIHEKELNEIKNLLEYKI